MSYGPLLPQTIQPSCWDHSLSSELDCEHDKQQCGSVADARQRNACSISAARAVRDWRPLICFADVATHPSTSEHHRSTKLKYASRCVYFRAILLVLDCLLRCFCARKVFSVKVLGVHTVEVFLAQLVEPSEKENYFREQAPFLMR